MELWCKACMMMLHVLFLILFQGEPELMLRAISCKDSGPIRTQIPERCGAQFHGQDIVQSERAYQIYTWHPSSFCAPNSYPTRALVDINHQITAMTPSGEELLSKIIFGSTSPRLPCNRLSGYLGTAKTLFWHLREYLPKTGLI